jgi:hypothetical protein
MNNKLKENCDCCLYLESDLCGVVIGGDTWPAPSPFQYKTPFYWKRRNKMGFYIE